MIAGAAAAVQKQQEVPFDSQTADSLGVATQHDSLSFSPQWLTSQSRALHTWQQHDKLLITNQACASTRRQYCSLSSVQLLISQAQKPSDWDIGFVQQLSLSSIEIAYKAGASASTAAGVPQLCSRQHTRCTA